MGRTAGTPSGLSPEQRRRQSLTRRPVFTVAMAGPDVQRRFVLRQRLWFGLMVAACPGSACLSALALDAQTTDLIWAFGGGALFLLILSGFMRRRLPAAQPVLMSLGLVGAGLTIGWALPRGPDTLASLLNAAVLVGGLLGGGTVNALWYTTERSTFREHLWTGPWLLAALAACWFLPAGEWVLAVCGGLAVVLMFCLLRAGREALAVHRPNESVVAAADVVPLAFLGPLNWLLGRD